MSVFQTRVLWVILIAMMLVFAVILAISCRSRNKLTLEEVETTIDENVSQGENKEKIHVWLAEMGWTYYHFSAATHGLDQWAGGTIADHAQIDRRAIASWTRVTLEEDASWKAIWPKRIIIYFLFGKDDALIKYYCREEQVMP